MRRRAQPYARSDTDRIMNDLFRSLGAGVVAYGMTLGANEKTANGFTTSVLYRSRNVKISVGKYGRDLYIGLFNEVPEVVVHMSSDTIDQEKIPRIVDEIVSIVIRKSEALSESNGSMSDSEGKVVTNPEISVQNREKNKATQSNANHWLDSLKSSMDKEFGNKVSDFNEFEVSMQKFSVNFTLHNLKIYIVALYNMLYSKVVYKMLYSIII